MKTCLVLMCTYNGENYLREQLDSIFSQKDMEISVKVADDRSTDTTSQILQEYRERYPNRFEYSINKTNKGFAYNFIDLFFSAQDGYDYYAFSDQDDVWLPEKLKRAAEKVEEKGESKNGVLYCSNLIVADESLNRIGMMDHGNNLKATENTIIFRNIATGCTIFFDRTFFLHCRKYYPQGITLHDYWFFIVAVYTADYVYDGDGFILYRQHSNNVIGSSSGKRKRKARYPLAPCLKELLIGYREDISEKNKKILTVGRDYRKNLFYKCKVIFSKKYSRDRCRIRFIFAILRNKI